MSQTPLVQVLVHGSNHGLMHGSIETDPCTVQIKGLGYNPTQLPLCQKPPFVSQPNWHLYGECRMNVRLIIKGCGSVQKWEMTRCRFYRLPPGFFEEVLCEIKRGLNFSAQLTLIQLFGIWGFWDFRVLSLPKDVQVFLETCTSHQKTKGSLDL